MENLWYSDEGTEPSQAGGIKRKGAMDGPKPMAWYKWSYKPYK